MNKALQFLVCNCFVNSSMVEMIRMPFNSRPQILSSRKSASRRSNMSQAGRILLAGSNGEPLFFVSLAIQLRLGHISMQQRKCTVRHVHKLISPVSYELGLIRACSFSPITTANISRNLILTAHIKSGKSLNPEMGLVS